MQAVEEISKNLQAMKGILYGEGPRGTGSARTGDTRR